MQLVLKLPLAFSLANVMINCPIKYFELRPYNASFLTSPLEAMLRRFSTVVTNQRVHWDAFALPAWPVIEASRFLTKSPSQDPNCQRTAELCM